MILLLLVIEVKRPVRRGNGLWENRHRQNCQGAPGSCLESGLRSPGWGGKGGRNPSWSQRQSLSQPTTTSGLGVCNTDMHEVRTRVQES